MPMQEVFNICPWSLIMGELPMPEALRQHANPAGHEEVLIIDVFKKNLPTLA
jgi:hypothetical protein